MSEQVTFAILIRTSSGLPLRGSDDIKGSVPIYLWLPSVLQPWGCLIVFFIRVLLAFPPGLFSSGLPATILGCFLHEKDVHITCVILRSGSSRRRGVVMERDAASACS
ncbi:hypothetical protein J3459_016283 [Metarhizium acridum]|nr:hypothetical protein J3459_016518 [Metarhizium acridum]KAG8411783.1 hypothetical protein J3459_016283 [Metarhizium acridum]